MVWFQYPFHFVEKNNSEHTRKTCKVLRVVHREGEFFTIPTVFALEGSIEKNCLKMEWYSFCSCMGPNQERRTDQIASRLSVSTQVSFIKTVTYKGIILDSDYWILWWFDGLPLVALLFICSKLHFEFLQASSDLVCYTAVFSVVTQRSSPREERCVTAV